MQGDRRDQSEFTIERGGERDAGAGKLSSRSASNAPHGAGQSGQAEFDLAGTAGGQPDSAMPDRLRRKYYVVEAGTGDEAKVYADPRGEYLAFKVSADRMATRLEDAGLIRDMLSVAQHRGWGEVEVRGSEEFRRIAWLEASVRGLPVRGFEPDPVDRAALAFRANPEVRANKTPQSSTQTRYATASETVSVDGFTINRPINVTIMPPELGETSAYARNRAHDAEPTGWRGARQTTVEFARYTPRGPAERSGITIELAASKDSPSIRGGLDPRQSRAHRFRNGDMKGTTRDDAVEAARSQLAAIEKALAKSVRDPALLQSVLNYAKNRISGELERGRLFERINITQKEHGRRNHSPNAIKNELPSRPVNRGYPDLDR